MINHLKELKNEAEWRSAYDFVSKVLDDPRFEIWTGSGKDIHHHYGDGGLLQHTFEVAEYTSQIADTHGFLKGFRKDLNHLELFISAIWHDYGKLWDYQKVDGVWGKHNKHARQIHHISRSALEWEKHCDQVYDYHPELVGVISKDAVTHNILAHHGCREWGSPVAPATKEAWILHLADNMSARLDDCDKHDRF